MQRPIWSRLTLALTLALSLSGPGVLAQAPPGPNSHAISMYNLGLTAYKQGSPESAIIFFKRACDIDPDLADAQYNLAVLYQSEKRLKDAIPRFQEVLRIKPGDPDAHYQLGIALMDSSRLSEAKPHFLAVPTSSSHYADAQKRAQLCDQGVAAPQSSQPVTMQPPRDTPIGAPDQPVATQTTIQPTNDAAPQQLAAPPAQALVAQQPVQQQQQVTPVQQPPAAPPTPVALQQNSSVKVIAQGFQAPSGLAYDHAGNLYVANFVSNTIDRVSPDGIKAPFATGTGLKGPIGLVIDGSSNVYVANYYSGTILRISPAGIASVIAQGFKNPYYLTLDKDGNLVISQQEDNSVIRLSLPKPIVAKPGP